MKVLAVSHDSLLYGAQRSLLDVVDGLVDAGHEVHVCLPRAGPLVDRLNQRGIPTHLLKVVRWIPSEHQGSWSYWIGWLASLPRSLGNAIRLIRTGRFDVVYTNTVTVLDFALAAWLCKVPHVWHLREAAAGNTQLRSPLSNETVARITRALSKRVIFNSHALQRRYGAPNRNDIVVHNGIKPLPDIEPGLSRFSGKAFHVVTIGYMDQRKGLDVLLDALMLLPDGLKARTTLSVAGNVEESHMDRDIMPRLTRVGVKVEFLGWVERAEEVLAGADLLVSSARDEPFGRTLVEAMLSGVPVLATRSGGPEEIVVDGVTGLLVPPDDPRQLSAGIVRLFSDPGQLEVFGRAGRERALAEFSFERCLAGVEGCLRQAVSETRTESPHQA